MDKRIAELEETIQELRLTRLQDAQHIFELQKSLRSYIRENSELRKKVLAK